MKNQDPLIRAGKYRHYKGNVYKVIGIAHDSETLKEMVVYRATDSERQLWVRSLEEFKEKVKVGEETVRRFEYLD